jgi:hypothetical protein
MTYYALLGVAIDAEFSQIKAAYRQLQLKYHPDKNSAPDAVNHFIQVCDAFKVLSDPKARAEYDAQIKVGLTIRLTTGGEAGTGNALVVQSALNMIDLLKNQNIDGSSLGKLAATDEMLAHEILDDVSLRENLFVYVDAAADRYESIALRAIHYQMFGASSNYFLNKLAARHFAVFKLLILSDDAEKIFSQKFFQYCLVVYGEAATRFCQTVPEVIANFGLDADSAIPESADDFGRMFAASTLITEAHLQNFLLRSMQHSLFFFVGSYTHEALSAGCLVSIINQFTDQSLFSAIFTQEPYWQLLEHHGVYLVRWCKASVFQCALILSIHEFAALMSGKVLDELIQLFGAAIQARIDSDASLQCRVKAYRRVTELINSQYVNQQQGEFVKNFVDCEFGVTEKELYLQDFVVAEVLLRHNTLLPEHAISAAILHSQLVSRIFSDAMFLAELCCSPEKIFAIALQNKRHCLLVLSRNELALKLSGKNLLALTLNFGTAVSEQILADVNLAKRLLAYTLLQQTSHAGSKHYVKQISLDFDNGNQAELFCKMGYAYLDSVGVDKLQMAAVYFYKAALLNHEEAFRQLCLLSSDLPESYHIKIAYLYYDQLLSFFDEAAAQVYFLRAAAAGTEAALILLPTFIRKGINCLRLAGATTFELPRNQLFDCVYRYASNANQDLRMILMEKLFWCAIEAGEVSLALSLMKNFQPTFIHLFEHAHLTMHAIATAQSARGLDPSSHTCVSERLNTVLPLLMNLATISKNSHRYQTPITPLLMDLIETGLAEKDILLKLLSLPAHWAELSEHYIMQLCRPHADVFQQIAYADILLKRLTHADYLFEASWWCCQKAAKSVPKHFMALLEKAYKAGHPDAGKIHGYLEQINVDADGLQNLATTVYHCYAVINDYAKLKQVLQHQSAFIAVDSAQQTPLQLLHQHKFTHSVLYFIKHAAYLNWGEAEEIASTLRLSAAHKLRVDLAMYIGLLSTHVPTTRPALYLWSELFSKQQKIMVAKKIMDLVLGQQAELSAREHLLLEGVPKLKHLLATYQTLSAEPSCLDAPKPIPVLRR